LLLRHFNPAAAAVDKARWPAAALRPGQALTELVAEDREVASLVAYLASPLAAATNGAAMRVEGGVLRTIF
jgi:NAD(P)-dependent dehydrogenase (short-subunit alcohol dehydrogenase family)